MIDAAVVGLGWWGRVVVERLRGSRVVRVVRAVGRSAASAAFAAKEGLPLSRSLEDALADARVRAVILCSPNSVHEAQVVAAAQAGRHVFCEKPLALTRAAAARAVAACASAGVVLGIGHERRWEPAMVEIRRLIDAGALGTVMHVESNFSHDKLAGVDPGNWRASSAEAPAAAMTAMGVHLTDAYIGMLGPVAELDAMTARRVLTWETGDVVTVQMRFRCGATGSLSAILATPLFLRFQVFGSEAWVEARDTAHPDGRGVTHLTVFRTGREPERRELPSIDTVRANLEAFAAACEGGPPYPVPHSEMIHNVAVLEAVVTSAAEGRVVRLT